MQLRHPRPHGGRIAPEERVPAHRRPPAGQEARLAAALEECSKGPARARWLALKAAAACSVPRPGRSAPWRSKSCSETAPGLGAERERLKQLPRGQSDASHRHTGHSIVRNHVPTATGSLLADEPLDARQPRFGRARRAGKAAPGTVSDFVRTLARARQPTHAPPTPLMWGQMGPDRRFVPLAIDMSGRSLALRTDQPPKAGCQASGSCGSLAGTTCSAGRPVS
jgi:hypothetical protein